MAAQFGALTAVSGLGATHVHVGVGDRALGVQVSNHIRGSVPVLQALCANSPYADGRDTGYASWRSILWSRWPTAAPAPLWNSVEHYEHTVGALVESGAILDERMAYWYTRLSASYPTIEIRPGDVCATVDESLLVAALARALVATAVGAARAGHPAAPVDDQLLAAAHWRAARDGPEGVGIDLVHGKPRPARELLDELVERLRPALVAAGDWDVVRHLLGQARTRGSGAHRQRSIGRPDGDLRPVVRFLVDETGRPSSVR
jgi:carboxylate-amine ligase